MNNIKYIVEQRGLSVRELSRITNVHKNTLIKYLDTDDCYLKDGRLRVYWKIANSFDVEVEELLYGDSWVYGDNVITTPISISDAVERKAVWLHTSHMDIHNSIRDVLGLSNYSTFSGYENYRWVPTIDDALKIAEFLNCTINALWGSYFRRK